MDDTQASSKADAATATRKRRSSILKNQRPPRTPFSEVELNVASPTDTTKSRRVSFSRRTGVAEFITNEATTTWKNFYEEHNKSLESSGNDSVANAPRQTIEHIGKCIFDQQFEEVEVIDYEDTSYANPLQEFEVSFNNINLTQQLASLECMTDNPNFAAPQSNFEQSALTELSKPFGNEIHVPTLEDTTNPISINFSAMKTLSSSYKCDDLDEIQKDLERSKPSDICPGPTRAGKDFSGFIEVVDLNMTHGAKHDDGSEMSITDTIESPKVHEVSRNDVSAQKGKRLELDNDWTNDKENIAINPYIAPKESLNFAVKEDSDEVLVFDGKRLRTQSIATKIPEVDKDNFRQNLLQDANIIAPQRKIQSNVNDDLSSCTNFIVSNSSESNNLKNDIQQEIFKNVNMSITTAIDNHIKRSNNTDVAITSLSNISSNVLNNHGKQDTLEISNISFTQAIPSNIISTIRETEQQNKDFALNRMRNNTIHYDNMTQDISMTQAIPNNIIHLSEEKELKIDKTEKRQTIIFNSDSCDLSMTQTLPTNFDKNENDYQTFKESVCKEKQTTIVFHNDACDISMTQALPTNINVHEVEIEKHYLINKKCSTNENSTEKRKTIIFDNDDCNISITQALPTNINFTKNESKKVILFETPKEPTEKRRTIIFDNDSCDMTQALLTNINVNKEKIEEKRKSVILDSESCDVSLTQDIPVNIYLNTNNNEQGIDHVLIGETKMEGNKTMVHDNNFADISSTSVKPNMLLQDSNEKAAGHINVSSSIKPEFNSTVINEPSVIYDNMNRTTIVDNDNNKSLLQWAALENINVTVDDNKLSTVTNPIPTNIIDIQKEVAFNIRANDNNSKFEQNDSCFHETEVKKNIVVYQVNTNKQTKEINIDRNDDDLVEKEANQSINNEINATTIYEESPLKFLNDEDKNATSDLEGILEKHSIEDVMSTSAKENTFCDNVHQTDSRDIKSKPKKSILNELLDMSRESISGIIQNNDIIGYNLENVNKPNEISRSTLKEQLSDLNTKERPLIINSDREMVVTNNISGDPSLIVIQKTRNIDSDLENGSIENSTMLRYSSEEFDAQGLDPLKVAQKNSKDQELKDKNAEYKIESDKSVTVIPDDLNYSFRKADRMKELLQIISDFTSEGGKESVTVTEKICNRKDLCEETSAEPAEVDGDMICEFKNDIEEPIRVSLAPKRQSIVISHKDLLNNISMAKAVLQQSRFEVDESDIMDDTSESIHTHKPNETHSTTHQISSEVIKTLQFEDESTIDTSTMPEKKISPLKKTPFGETYMNDGKVKVIPPYIKDISDNIKELLHDLVKPPPDMPFHDVLGGLPSTCSTEIQANLTTLSQIDVGIQLNSKHESVCNVKENNTGLTDTLINSCLKDLMYDLVKPTSDISFNNISGGLPSTCSTEVQTNLIKPRNIDVGAKLSSNCEPVCNVKKKNTALTDILQKTNSKKKIMHDLVKPTSDIAFNNVLGGLPSTHIKEVQANLTTSSQIDVDVHSNYDESVCNVKENNTALTATFITPSMRELMHDLVTSDIPFNIESSVLPTTCNMDVQAILTTSSDIDVGAELQSKYESISSVKESYTALSEILISSKEEDNGKQINHDITKTSSPQQSIPERILIFNPDNPLKNINLPFFDCSDAHKYNEFIKDNTNPVQIKDSTNPVEINDNTNPVRKAKKCRKKINDNKENQSITMYVELNKNTATKKVQQNVLTKPIEHDVDQQTSTQINMRLVDPAFENSSTTSNITKPLFINRSVENVTSPVKDTEVNTIIVMKENKELLNQSSSLTLVEEGFTNSECNVSHSSEETVKCNVSLVRVIFKTEHESKLLEQDSDVTSYEDINDMNDVESKARKRSYSPTNKDSCISSNVDFTPKPISKMQKMSNSSLPTSVDNKGEGDELLINDTSVSYAKTSKLEHPPSTKVNNTITCTKTVKNDVQNHCSKLNNTPFNASHRSSLETHTIISNSDIMYLDRMSSSSVIDMQNPSMTISQVLSSVTSQISNVFGENNVNKIERDSSADIVETINMLSFMGSPECEWDSPGVPDAWCFRLMHGRLRLRTRLARDSGVRADTPLLDIGVDIMQSEDKDSLRKLCVSLAAEAMRYEASRLVGPSGAARAEDVVMLLRRCVAVTRLARHWTLVMRDARARLAYDVMPDGLITLKVANIPLRCVWEVRMRVSLEVGAGGASAFPRAHDLSITAVLGCHAPPPATLRDLGAQPPDWGHAPRTLWKVFKYLKNRTRDKDLLGI